MKRFFKLVSMFVLAGATLTYTGCTDYDKDIDNLGQEVDALEGKLATLEQQVKNLEALKSQLETLKNTHDADVERIDKAIAAINKSLEGYATKTWAEQTFVTKAGLQDAITALGVFATKTEVSAAKSLAQEALDSAKTALGNVAALKTALGAYASESAIQAALNGKLDVTAFNQKFDEQLTAALANDGKITKAIAAALDSAVAEFAAMFYGELRSLVFVPELYVNGIESVEYTYAGYNKVSFSAGDNGTDEKDVTWKTDAKVKYAPVATASYIYPEKVVSYEMNPSSATVDAEKLSFLSKDVEAISRASVAQPKAAFVGYKEGNLLVSLSALGQKVKDQADGEATVFALQAIVKGESGKDTTVTSDYASIYASTLKFDAIAYSDKAHQAVDCIVTGKNDHLYSTAKAAFENIPTVKVAWDETVDLADLVEVHYSIASDTKNAVNHAVYDMEENPYEISLGFELIDYIAGSNKTSDSQFSQLKGSVLDPCGTDAGKANGEDHQSSIGRRPLVRVTAKAANGDVILVGYIKTEIVSVSGPTMADEFVVPAFKQACDRLSWTCTWDEMVDNILEKTNLSKEQFDLMYKLETVDGREESDAVQYAYDATENEFSVANVALGKVNLVKDDTPGTTTNVLKWSDLGPNEQQTIYAGNGATIYVRFIMKNQTPTSTNEGIYVPISGTVTKPEGNVTLKINEYWFNEGKDAIINVHVPQANASTIPWSTLINQVWHANQPKFNPTAGYDSYTETIFANQNGTNGGYKYYFAPEQPKLVVAGKTYQLTVASNEVFDINAVTGVTAKNAEIPTLEKKYSVDVTQGIYTNTELKVGTEVIAKIDQATGIVTYNDQSATAKLLLNAFASQPRSEALLLANIGVTAYSSCDIAMSLKNAVNPYHFLRPINIVASDDVEFVDGVDSHEPEANVNLFGMLNFTDWRGRKFYEGTDYTNLWYFKYYGVKSVKVDIANVTTTLNDGTLGTTKLSAVTNQIEVSHRDKSGNVVNGALDITLTSANAPGWGETQYKGLVDKFGYIHYQNNFSTVESAFQLRFPVEVTYDWGTIKVYVDATVQPTEGNE